MVSFGDFQKFYIQPLTIDESYSLLHNYDYYSYKEIADELVTILHDKRDKTLNEFLENPFLVSLLYKSFEYKKDIPIKKTQFYRQVYDALFEAHDLSKEGYLKREKYSNLHLDDFERVLRYIAFLTAIENKIEYEKDYILNIIDKARKELKDLNFKSSDFLKDLLEVVPLFKRDGSFFKWAHKSLQDYFAAKFIWLDSEDMQTNILRKIFEDVDNDRFFNVLDLFYELDPKIFESTILLWLLEDYKNYIEDPINQNIYVNSLISKEAVKTRIDMMYAYKVGFRIISSREKKPELDYDLVGEWAQEFDKLTLNDKRTFGFASLIEFDFLTKTFIVFIRSLSNIDTIIHLLLMRKHPIIKNSLNVNYDEKILKKLKTRKFYAIDTNGENPINVPLFFESINNFIIPHIDIFDRDIAMNKLTELHASRRSTFKNDLLNW